MAGAMEARFAHVNLVAHDWRRLAAFYREAFALEPVPPERRLSGPWLERATGMAGVRIEGVHLLLADAGGAPLTLEIFQYDPPAPAVAREVNRPGLGHVAFRVPEVAAALGRVRSLGGSAVGTVVRTEISGAGTITFVYARDPEGNIIELQSWSE